MSLRKFKSSAVGVLKLFGCSLIVTIMMLVGILWLVHSKYIETWVEIVEHRSELLDSLVIRQSLLILWVIGLACTLTFSPAGIFKSREKGD